MQNSDEFMAIGIIVIAIISFFFLRSKGIHMSFGTRYIGGRWRVVTKTVYKQKIPSSSDLKEMKESLDYEFLKLQRESMERAYKISKLKKIIGNKKMDDFIQSTSTNSNNSNKNLASIFKREKQQDALKIIIDDFQKECIHFKKNRRLEDSSNNIFFAGHETSNGTLETLFPMCKDEIFKKDKN